MRKISENIKTFRNMRGLTQTELAVLLHRSVGAVSNWEKGVNCPDVDTIEDICRILEVTPNEIFGWNDSKEQHEYLEELNEARKYINDVKKQRLEQEERIRNYFTKFGKLLSTGDIPENADL